MPNPHIYIEIYAHVGETFKKNLKFIPFKNIYNVYQVTENNISKS